MRIRRFVSFRSLFAALLLSVGLVAAIPAASAVAQEEGETTTATIFVRLCVDAGCSELLEATEPVDGLTVEVTDAETGDVLGSCVTGDVEPGACAVDMPWTPTVMLGFDPAAIPEGYAPTNNPEEFRFGDTPAASVEAPVLFYPEDGFPPENGESDAPPEADPAPPVDELPGTGTGAARGDAMPLVTGFLFGTVVLTVAGLVVRRGSVYSAPGQ